ncbi:GNAT family N-acetyltransferase [Actinosynnema sp. NPDC020468]|uniref:GNAT family N-acetyltransferase n=1 Tax=Actinosynnema sp. NPDC020468 TaxID=3154488 RepID=UPI0033D0FE2B
MGFTVRTLTSDDFDAFQRLVTASFLADPRPGEIARWRAVFAPERHHGVFEGDEMIGGAGVLPRRMTLPEARPVPVAAVTSVGVKPGHHRRGVGTALMRGQLHDLHEHHEPVAALWASEAGIYDRFGYGSAAEVARFEIPRGAAFRRGVDTGSDRPREVPRDEAMPLVTEVYERVRTTRTGWLDRSAGDWEVAFGDDEADRHGASALRWVVLPDGYAVYRVKGDWTDRGPRHWLEVVELTAADDVTFAALYRYLLDLDLVGEITFRTASDDPAPHLLTDPRAVRRQRGDSLWVRLVDVDRALPLRHYASDADAVLQVRDPLCPWNEGRWRFTARGGEAVARRADGDADLVLDVQALGAAFLGGTRLTTMARAQRVREVTPGVLETLSRAFVGDHDPHCPEVF